MARDYLKKGAATAQVGRAEVESTVRRMLAEIAEQRDAAVRKFARDLDKWTGEFRVPAAEVEAKTKSLPARFKEDFAFCHRQVTEFARRQKDSMRAFETEMEPGVVLGQKLIPVGSVGCYIPGGKYPLISAALMSVWHGQGGGRGTHHRGGTAARARRHPPANALCPASLGRRRDPLHRRGAGDGRHGLRLRRHAEVDMITARPACG